MNEEEVLLCTQKIMRLLMEMHQDGILDFEAFHQHTRLKISYLKHCSTKQKFSQYSNETLSILSCYRNILEENPAVCKIQV